MKLAVLGASFLQRDMIQKAKSLGHEVHALAWKKGEVVSDLVDGFHDVSLRDVSAVLAKCVSLEVDGVVTTSSDVAVPVMAAVVEEMGLIGIGKETAHLSTHKGAMRRALKAAGCSIPRFDVFSTMPSELDFSPPFLVKASDRSGSRGVTVVHDKAVWKSAYQSAEAVSFSGDVVVEEFFTGRQFSVEMISNEGRHYFCGLTEEFFDSAGTLCEKGNLVPGRLDRTQMSTVVQVVENGLDALGITVGPSHSEVRINEDGRCCIIEIGARLGGDFRNRLVQLAYGVDMDALVIRQALGEEVAFQHGEANSKAMISWVFDKSDLCQLKEASQSAFAHSHKFFDTVSMDVRPISSDQRWGYLIASGRIAEGSDWINREIERNGW